MSTTSLNPREYAEQATTEAHCYPKLAIADALIAIALHMNQEDPKPAEASESYTRADMARAWAEGAIWWATGGGRYRNPYADHPGVQDPPVDADKPTTSKERVLTEAERIIVADLLDEDADTGYRAAMTTTEAVTVTPEDMRRLADEIRHGRVTITEEES